MGDNMYYVKRSDLGICVVSKDGKQYYKMGIRKYLNLLCLKNMSTYDGRRLAALIFLKIKSNVPIYINKETIVYPTKSIRVYDTVFVNYIEVLSVKQINPVTTLFTFTNLDELIVRVSPKKIAKQHSKVKILINYMEMYS